MEKDRAGRTQLVNAIIDGDDELATTLLGQGADPDEVDNSGWCALHFAALNCSKKSVEILIDSGANLDLRDQNGNTPLWRATMSYRGEDEVISTLLQAGANPDADNNNGISPRSLANTIANYDGDRFFEGY